MNHTTPKSPPIPSDMLISVILNLLANPGVAINLEFMLQRVMPLDWQVARSTRLRGPPALRAEQR